MRQISVLILSAFILSCSTYSSGDLNGKWECFSEEQQIELWIKDSLAIILNIDNQLMNTYDLDYEGRNLTFSFIDDMKGSRPWTLKIIEVSDKEIRTELQNPGTKERTNYRRIAGDVPEISPNYELNWERYEDYMRAKLDSH